MLPPLSTLPNPLHRTTSTQNRSEVCVCMCVSMRVCEWIQPLLRVLSYRVNQINEHAPHPIAQCPYPRDVRVPS